MKKMIIALTFVASGIAQAAQEKQFADCVAYTYCPNMDYTVYCETYGQDCKTAVVDNKSVSCAGLDESGAKVSITRECLYE